jgi:hypothetical protein
VRPRRLHAEAALLVSLLALPYPAPAADPSLADPAPITLEEADVGGGWFLYRLHEGSLEEMGALFARIALIRNAMQVEGDLVAVLLGASEHGDGLLAEVGLLMRDKPERYPRAYLLRRFAACHAAVGNATGSWGNASLRAGEVRAWAMARGMTLDGAARLVFLGDPLEQETLSWQVVVPVCPDASDPEGAGPGTGEETGEPGRNEVEKP